MPEVIVPPPPAPVVSPTGTPVLPPQVAKWALPVVGIAAAITMAPDMGIALPVACVMWSKLLVLIGTLLGIASPGARR